jgi:assimilatory nitrate reductase catalytic subunit
MAGRDFDIGAWADTTDADYDAMPPFRWPAPRGAAAPDRFFAGGGFFTPDRRARMVPVAWADRGAEGLRLNTGRVRDHWHTMTRTGLSPRLSAHIAEPYVEINPADAARLGIAPATIAAVEGPAGRALLRARVTDDTPAGSVFAPFHWTAQTAPAARVNAAVTTACDPVSGQPGLKGGAVTVAPAPMAWFGFVISRTRPDSAACTYAALARSRGGWRAELAGAAVPEDWEGFAARLCGLVPARSLTLTGPRPAHFRVAFLDGEGRLAAALYAAPEPIAAARGWVAGALAEAGRDPATLLAGHAGRAMPDPGPTVCACFEVGLNTIREAIAAQRLESVEAIGAALSAGAGCGACRPELSRLLTPAPEAAA